MLPYGVSGTYIFSLRCISSAQTRGHVGHKPVEESPGVMPSVTWSSAALPLPIPAGWEPLLPAGVMEIEVIGC